MMQFWPIRFAVPVTVLVCCVLLVGCSDTPSAPALRDSPVYHNRQEGFRFLVPDGWTQSASANLPSGPVDRESFLVRYHMRTPDEGATLQILCLQDSESLNLAQHHAGPSFRVQQWKPMGKPETLQINGVETQRMVFTATTPEGRAMTKEVVCFRQNGRVYSFVGLFLSRDDKAREQIRRAVSSVIWE